MVSTLRCTCIDIYIYNIIIYIIHHYKHCPLSLPLVDKCGPYGIGIAAALLVLMFVAKRLAVAGHSSHFSIFVANDEVVIPFTEPPLQCWVAHPHPKWSHCARCCTTQRSCWRSGAFRLPRTTPRTEPRSPGRPTTQHWGFNPPRKDQLPSGNLTVCYWKWP